MVRHLRVNWCLHWQFTYPIFSSRWWLDTEVPLEDESISRRRSPSFRDGNKNTVSIHDSVLLQWYECHLSSRILWQKLSRHARHERPPYISEFNSVAFATRSAMYDFERCNFPWNAGVHNHLLSCHPSQCVDSSGNEMQCCIPSDAYSDWAKLRTD